MDSQVRGDLGRLLVGYGGLCGSTPLNSKEEGEKEEEGEEEKEEVEGGEKEEEEEARA